MDKITGKNNELIKDIKRLMSSSQKRKDKKLFVLEGARLSFDILNSFYEVDTFLITQTAYDKYTDLANMMFEKSERGYIISDEVSQKLSETKNSQGVYAVCRMKDDDFVLDKNGKYIILDNVQDPGNVGTIIRTAEALGISAAFVSSGCDIYNPKVLRASMGSVLRLNVIRYGDAAACVKELKQNGIKVYSTSPNSDALDITNVSFTEGCACVIGNEANGVQDSVIALSDATVKIRMLGNAESLNASVAGAITMWEMLR